MNGACWDAAKERTRGRGSSWRRQRKGAASTERTKGRTGGKKEGDREKCENKRRKGEKRRKKRIEMVMRAPRYGNNYSSAKRMKGLLVTVGNKESR